MQALFAIQGIHLDPDDMGPAVDRILAALRLNLKPAPATAPAPAAESVHEPASAKPPSEKLPGGPAEQGGGQAAVTVVPARGIDLSAPKVGPEVVGASKGSGCCAVS